MALTTLKHHLLQQAEDCTTTQQQPGQQPQRTELCLIKKLLVDVDWRFPSNRKLVATVIREILQNPNYRQLNQRDGLGMDSLMYAIYAGNLEVAEALLKHVSFELSSSSHLFWAITCSHQYSNVLAGHRIPGTWRTRYTHKLRLRQKLQKNFRSALVDRCLRVDELVDIAELVRQGFSTGGG